MVDGERPWMAVARGRRSWWRESQSQSAREKRKRREGEREKRVKIRFCVIRAPRWWDRWDYPRTSIESPPTTTHRMPNCSFCPGFIGSFRHLRRFLVPLFSFCYVLFICMYEKLGMKSDWAQKGVRSLSISLDRSAAALDRGRFERKRGEFFLKKLERKGGGMPNIGKRGRGLITSDPRCSLPSHTL